MPSRMRASRLSRKTGWPRIVIPSLVPTDEA
jgi:hypothetical protein